MPDLPAQLVKALPERGSVLVPSLKPHRLRLELEGAGAAGGVELLQSAKGDAAAARARLGHEPVHVGREIGSGEGAALTAAGESAAYVTIWR